VWCGEAVEFGPPWRHVSDGATIRLRDTDSGPVDDHVATPDYRTAQIGGDR
jgi:hypothetical protein